MADEATISSPKKKKLPFKPTALRKAAPAPPKDAVSGDQDQANLGDDDDGLELFRRAKEMAPIVAADRERRLLKKQRQQQQEEEERRQADEEKHRRKAAAGEKRQHEKDVEDEELEATSPRERRQGESSRTVPDILEGDKEDSFASENSQPVTAPAGSFREPFTPPPSKRSRHDSTPSHVIASSPDQAHSVPDSSPSAHLLRSQSKLDSRIMPAGPPSKNHHVPASGSAPIISLESDSDDDVRPIPRPYTNRPVDRNPSPGPSIAHDVEDEDDEFAEYERKAAEQRARDLAEAGKEQVDVWVRSEIPGAKQCMFKFLFNRPLRLVRDNWVAYQLKKGVVLPPDQRDDILLTWRGKRIYNTSTLLSLGIRPDGDGHIATDGFSREGLKKDRTGIELEAWTLDLFQKLEREQELRRRREADEGLSFDGDGEDDGARDGHGDAPTPPPAAEVKLKIFLKARDDEVKLTVRPETTVDTLIAAFRAQRSVEPDKIISLWFDGEQLGAQVTIAEAEIDDRDVIEVHIKAPVAGALEIDD